MLQSGRPVFRRVDPISDGDALESKRFLGKHFLHTFVFQKHVFEIDEFDDKSPHGIRYLGEHVANDLVERPPVEKGHLRKKDAEAKVHKGVPGGALEELFGLRELGEGEEAYSFFAAGNSTGCAAAIRGVATPAELALKAS